MADELFVKPPIGVAPHWYFYRRRIEALNEAIGRYLSYIAEKHCTMDTRDSYLLISRWAKEIEELSLLIVNLEEMEKENG